jgi:hypothetical protein
MVCTGQLCSARQRRTPGRLAVSLAVAALAAQGTSAFQTELKTGKVPFFDIGIAYKLYDVLDPGPEQGTQRALRTQRAALTPPMLAPASLTTRGSLGH